MADRAFQDGFRRLTDTGLMLDLQTPWRHLPEAGARSAIAPHVPLILNHAGLPPDRSAARAGARRRGSRAGDPPLTGP